MSGENEPTRDHVDAPDGDATASHQPASPAASRDFADAQREHGQAAATHSAAPPDDATTSRAPQQAGRTAGEPFAPPGYELRGELGRGGMGVVYEARHAKLDRVVALKAR